MKILKNLFAVLFLVIINNSTFAQEGVERNIEWLKLNSYRLDHVHCPTSNFFGDIYDVNNEGVKLYNEAGDQQCSIKRKEYMKSKPSHMIKQSNMENTKAIIWLSVMEETKMPMAAKAEPKNTKPM